MGQSIVFHLNIDVNVAHAKPSCGPRSLSVDGGAHICHIITRDKKCGKKSRVNSARPRDYSDIFLAPVSSSVQGL